MDRFLLNIYIFFILASVIFVGHEELMRFFVVTWLCGTIYMTAKSRKNGVHLIRWLARYTVYFLPALVSSSAALYAKWMGNNNEWANGILEIWVHPFLSVLELFPVKEMWGMSSLFLLSCFVPVILILIQCTVCLFVRPRGI